jgi:hypothetical protein
MNKLLIFPIMIMMMLVAISFVNVGTLPGDATHPLNDNGYWTKKVDTFGSVLGYWHNSNTGSDYLARNVGVTGMYYYPPDHPTSPFTLFNTDNNQLENYDNLTAFNTAYGVTGTTTHISGNLFDSSWFWGILVAALIASIASGIQVFGSGMSEYSQRNLFISIMWGAIWAFLTVGTGTLLLNSTFGNIGYLIYGSLTICYIIGVIHTSESQFGE